MRKQKLTWILMKCNKPVLLALLKKRLRQVRNHKNMTLEDFLQNNRREIKDFLREYDNKKRFKNKLFPHDSSPTNVENWNIELLILFMIYIFGVSKSVRFYMQKTLKIQQELCRMHEGDFRKAEYKRYRRHLRKMRYKCYKKLRNWKLENKTEALACKIYSNDVRRNELHAFYWTVTGQSRDSKDTTPWTACITRQDRATASLLIDQEVLPSNEELLMAFDVFDRSSETFLTICKMINRVIESKSQGINGTWTSYHANKKQIVFVVETNEKSMEVKVADYHIYVRSTRESNGECALLFQTCCKCKTKEEQIILEKLRKSINKHADNLMNSHSKLSVVLPSLKKSVGYKSRNQRIIDEPCITLYVPVKGLIPIEEDPFPKRIDDFQVDVIEGEFVPYAGYANDFHEHLKMGLAIHGNARDKNGEILGGTLGGFVDHPVHGLCGISSAHALLSRDNLVTNQTNCSIEVSQPIGLDSKPFGEIVSVLCCAGDASSPGMEVVLFKIHQRHPIDGSFPEAFNYTDAGFDDENPLTYNSGKVLKASEINRRRKSELYKFGMATGVTRGAFAYQGAAVRLEKMEGQSYGLGFCLKNQIVALKIGDSPFADVGDSGALVLSAGEDIDSVAVGIVVGGLQGSVFVTPIHDILMALGCTDGMYQFNTSPFGICSPDSGIMTDDPDLMETNIF
ncbi:uncharacterized protein LOC128546561 [Mercenaria mercenaria]|uniref:uncharacterized protein LOC128546561 n=1 Tax=Mercenaria mercenaria TaxID=6596 RepID=UPI00234FA220|nr:uncharacterized protein LOC128546561 [Mercenaria mercenaria]